MISIPVWLFIFWIAITIVFVAIGIKVVITYLVIRFICKFKVDDEEIDCPYKVEVESDENK